MPFPVTCPACGKSFSISDDVYDQKIKGRVVSVKCKQCQAAIRVDGTKGVVAAKTATPAAQPAPPAAAPPATAQPPSAESAPAAPRSPAAAPAAPPEEPSPPAAPAPPPGQQATPEPPPQPPAALQAPAPRAEPTPAPAEPAPSEILFAVDSPEGDKELTVQQIAADLARGALTGDTLVWREGMAEWSEISKVPELAQQLKPAPAPKVATPKPAPVAEAPKGFRPRQPTLPMGAIPGPVLGKPAAGVAREPKAAAGTSIGAFKPRSATPIPSVEPKPVGAAPRVGTPGAGLPRPGAGVSPLARGPQPAPRATLPTPDPLDEEPTVLRSPEAMAALLSGTPEETPSPVRPPVAPRDEARLPPLPAAGKPSPFATPEARVTAEPPPDFGAPPPPPPAPRAPPASSPIGTFRESPDAKRAWFPEAAEPGVSPTAPLVAPPSPFALSPSVSPAASPAAPPAGPAPPIQPVMLAPLAAPTPFPSTVSFDEDVPFRPKRRTGLWVVLILLIALGLAAAYFFLGRKQAPLPAAMPTSTAEPRATVGETGASSPATAAPASTETATASDSNTEGSGLPGRPAASRGSGSFADLFAAGAKHAEGDTGARFDARAAKAVLDALMLEAARCRERGGPTGLTRVVVTFAPNGSVASAVVSDPPLAGTTTGNCISSVMKRATVPAFGGQTASVTQRISIQ